MKLIILAAGRGYGLDSFTADKPKCMLSIGKETIIGRQLRILRECGIKEEDITVVAGYQKDCLKLPEKIKKIVNDRYESTGNAYSLALALKDIDDDVIALDGDIIFEKRDIERLIERKENILAALDKRTGYGSTGINIDPFGKVIQIGKHVDTDKTYASIMKVRRQDLNLIKKELQSTRYEKTWYTIPLGKVLDQIEFKLLMIEGQFYEVNSYVDYMEVKKNMGMGEISILVTGASGFLGKKIYHILKRKYTVSGIRGHGNDEKFMSVDMTEKEDIEAYISLMKPDIIVHTAGVAEPDICEKDKELARQLNIQATENLVNACIKSNIKLIHISTDYVFDGEKEGEYERNSERNPKNYYGRTKKDAENIVKKYENSLIVRVPVLYGYNNEYDKETFPTKVLRQLRYGMEIQVDNQQIRYPVLIDEVALAIEDALWKKGVIHISSQQGVTKYEWARIIAEEFGYDGTLIKESDKLLDDRPRHVKLKIESDDYQVSDVAEGTRILKRQMNCIFKLIYKSMPNQHIYGKNVGKYRYDLGKKLGEIIPQDIAERLDYIIPVPSSGLFYAMGLAEKINVPYLQALVKPDTRTRSFQIADLSLREKVIREKIYAISELLDGKTVAVVDEAIFTGITLRVVCDMMRACGTKEIYICIPTPVCRNKCTRYVQPDRNLLIDQENEKRFKEYFNAEGIFFQHIDNLVSSIGNSTDICCECFCE